ncbi:MAG: response regulator [Lachnospiraceae bacterium]|nr:response regulator [Lachnospiraceae bacterium]
MYKYVVIDDEELIRKGIIKKLSPMADQICCAGEAENGSDGIQLIENVHPDFVILDMQMPVMDGMALLPYLAENFPGLPLIVISGYRDFEYVKQAISSSAVDYILKPFSREMIQDCVKTVLERLNNRSSLHEQIRIRESEREKACYDYDIQLLLNLIQGQHVFNPELTSQKLQFINETHQFILLTIHHQPAEPDIQALLSGQGIEDFTLYFTDGTLGFLIFFIPESASSSIEQRSNRSLDTLLSGLCSWNADTLVGISQMHAGLAELSRAYQETSQALDCQLIGQEPVSHYFYQQNNDPKRILWDKEDEFLFRVEAGMSEEVSRLIQELFTYFKTLSACTLGDVKYFCYRLAGQCMQVISEYLKSPDAPSESASVQNIVQHIFTLSGLEDYYRQFFVNISIMLKPQSVYATEDVIEKIKIYIQRNYQKNLNQDFVASLFFLNRSYLSTLFKTRTQKKFVDYLNEIRLEKSKELLADTDRKMYQIARNVGYDNVKYFFRVFKKKYGITPEQYRQQAAREKKN